MTGSDAATGSTKQALPPGLPLFYREPELLVPERHGKLRMLMTPDFRFARDTNAVPIMAGEFVQAARFYPVVFAGEPIMPVAVLGLERRNVFVDDAGAWDGPRTYIPAYVRRYPFTFIALQGVFALGIDMACDRLISGGEASNDVRRLFEDGKPTPFTQDALRFCGALQGEQIATRTFAEALAAYEILVDQSARAVSGSGRNYDLQGFRIVDAKKLAALPDAVVIDWQKRGWLALIHAHIASLACWHDLVARVGEREVKSGEGN
ncbi:MAG: SapC family protein [Rhizomicrobium sp.]